MTIRLHIKPYIQPFERRLALLEAQALLGEPPIPMNKSEFVFHSKTQRKSILDSFLSRAAYWEKIEIGETPNLTLQARREATVNVVRNGVAIDYIENSLPFDLEVPLVNRRCLRYATHGIHEYRGKFFPQLVRSLLNICDFPRSGSKPVVADPMMGSGTTAVETVLSGYTALGLDINPLSVLVAKTKCSALSLSFVTLSASYERVRETLLFGDASSFEYLKTLGEKDREYLSNWFSPQVLDDLSKIMGAISKNENAVVRDFMLVSLSNIIRKVSWQKDDDLRVRREIRSDVEIDAIREFLEELGRSVRSTLAFLRENQGQELGEFRIGEGDARHALSAWKRRAGHVDAVITSPPYATALPYLDTDRLSLIFLGLLPKGKLREKDREMIGNREITEGIRREYWEAFVSGNHGLPDSVSSLINDIHKRNTGTDAGFRRRNLPPLLAKYFVDMRATFADMAGYLRDGANAFVVVGDNHTIAGGERVDIRTSDLLGEIAESVGLRFEDKISMDMLVNRDIHRNNSMQSESILSLRKV